MPQERLQVTHIPVLVMEAMVVAAELETLILLAVEMAALAEKVVKAPQAPQETQAPQELQLATVVSL